MNYLLSGMESKDRVKLLLSLTRIGSDEIKAAIYDHLCRGFTEASAATINGVPKQNLSRSLVKLNKVVETTEKLKNIELAERNQLSDDK